jgi:hypothetical protein
MADVRLEWNDDLQQFVVFQMPNIFLPADIVTKSKRTVSKSGILTIYVDENDIKQYTSKSLTGEDVTPPIVLGARATLVGLKEVAKTAPAKKAIELLSKYESYRTSEGAIGTLAPRPPKPPKEPTGIQRLFQPSKEISLPEAASQVGVELPTSTAAQVPPVFEYGAGTVQDVGRTTRGGPLRPTVGASIPFETVQKTFDEKTGTFTYNGETSILLPQRGSQLSTPVNLDKFRRVTLFNLPSEEIAQYQKQFKLKETGRMDSELAARITERAQAASTENILRLNPEVQDKTQISWQDAALGKTLSSTAGGGGVQGPTPEQIKAYTRSVQIKSNELGVDLDEATLRGIVNSFARGEITSENLDEVIVRRGTIDFGQPLKGAVAEQMAALKQSAAAYGIQYNDDWYRTSILNVLKGEADVETYNQQIKDLAKSQYPTLAAQIDAGYTVQSIASPYISTMSQILELNPGEITLYDDTIRKALTGINDKNQPSLKPLWEFERDLKKDERWRYTKNAEQDLMGTGIKLLRNFGLV